MAWRVLQVPLFPRTRRTADGTFYTHDGAGKLRVREHHVKELSGQAGVRAMPSPTAAAQAAQRAQAERGQRVAQGQAQPAAQQRSGAQQATTRPVRRPARDSSS